MKKITEEVRRQIIKMYQDGLSPSEIGVKFDLHSGSVGRIVKKSGIVKNQRTVINEDLFNFMKEKYESGMSSEKIAEIIGIDSSSICRKLKKNGVVIRTASENNRKYHIDETFFEKINNEEKAYFLGLIYSNGYLNAKDKSIRVLLRNSDKNILEKLSSLIFKENRVKETKNKGRYVYSYIRIYSSKIYDCLINMGKAEKKKLILNFPNFIREDLKRHFIRGCYDGDGFFLLMGGGSHLGITSNTNIINGIAKYFSDTLNINSEIKIKNEKKNLSSLKIKDLNQIDIVVHHLYDNSNFYINRIYKKYLRFLELKNNFDKNKLKRQNKIEKVKDKYTNIKNYGTTYIVPYQNMLLTSDNLINMTEEQKNDAAKIVFDFYRNNGFPYSNLSKDELLKDFIYLKNIDIKKINKDNILNLNNYSGISIFKHFAPHFYEAKSSLTNNSLTQKPSMIEGFHRDDILLRVINERLSKNKNMNGNMIKQGLFNSYRVYRASIFFPSIAKFLYSKYTQEGDIIYDYSMGFGQRLLGALSLPHNIKYVGVDPFRKSFESNVNIFQFFKDNIPMFKQDVDLRCCGAEEFIDEQYKDKIKFAFSSPPYYNLERYVEEESQCYYSRSYVDFINEWWRKVVDNIDYMLAPDGIFAINIKDKVDNFSIKDDMVNVIREKGYEIIDMYQIQLTRNTSFNNKDGSHKYEPIILLKRK